MSTITFDNSKPFDIVCSGRIAVDFNPVDLNQPLEDCTTFKKLSRRLACQYCCRHGQIRQERGIYRQGIKGSDGNLRY